MPAAPGVPIVRGVTQNPESLSLLRHLAGKPGNDEVKADFRQLLTSEFDVPLEDVRFERKRAWARIHKSADILLREIAQKLTKNAE